MDLIQSYQNKTTSIKVSLHGATLLSYIYKGREHLFLSPYAVYGDKAIRDGVPVCWPWFGRPEGKTPHGYARISQWHIVSEEISEELIDVKLELKGQSAALFLQIKASYQLEMFLTMRNDDEIEFPMSSALHSYFSVPVKTAVIKNLPDLVNDELLNCAYDNEEEELRFDYPKPLDRVYKHLKPDHFVLLDDLKIIFHNCDSIIVWNPGEAAALAMDDLKSCENFVCVEAGLLMHQPLLPKQELTFGFTVYALENEVVVSNFEEVETK